MLLTNQLHTNFNKFYMATCMNENMSVRDNYDKINLQPNGCTKLQYNMYFSQIVSAKHKIIWGAFNVNIAL